MRFTTTGRRLRLVLATGATVALAAVATAAPASAAPRDNLANAAKCLRGWSSLQTSSGRAFPGPLACVLYALRGGTFGTSTPTPPTPPESTPTE